jgi:hypothetical protein
MNKSFQAFLTYYKGKTTNNYVIGGDYIVYDELYLNFWDYPKRYITQNFKSFFKYYLKKRAYPELIALFHFKYIHFNKVRVYKNNIVHYFTSPYKERARTISYPIDDDYNFFLTITYRSPFAPYSPELFSIISYNDYLNGLIKKGFKRMRDYIRRHYQLAIKKELSNMDYKTFYSFYGFFPTANDINDLAKSEATRLTRETFKYFRVYETHKSNVIHCHALIKLPKFIQDMDFKDIISMLASWFETEPNGIELDRIQYRRPNQYKKEDPVPDIGDAPDGGSGKLKNYILKYLNKQFMDSNLVYVDKSPDERVYILKTSAFVINFIPRLTTYSRGTITKRYKPYSSYSSEILPEPTVLRRESYLSEGSVPEVDYEDYKYVVDRLRTVKQRREQIRNDIGVSNELKITQSVNLLNSYLNEDFVVYFDHELNPIVDAIYLLKNHKEHYILSYLAEKKLNNDFEEVDF